MYSRGNNNNNNNNNNDNNNNYLYTGSSAHEEWYSVRPEYWNKVVVVELNFSATSLTITPKVSSSERKRIFSVDRKCSNFSMLLRLRTPGKLISVPWLIGTKHVPESKSISQNQVFLDSGKFWLFIYLQPRRTVFLKKVILYKTANVHPNQHLIVSPYNPVFPLRRNSKSSPVFSVCWVLT